MRLSMWGYCCLVNIFRSSILWGYVWLIVRSPINYVGFIIEKAIEVHDVKTRTKEHSKQSNTNKIKFIYQQIHEKGNITNILI